MLVADDLQQAKRVRVAVESALDLVEAPLVFIGKTRGGLVGAA